MAPPKTNVCRLLDKAGARYEMRTYDVADGHIDGPSVAAKVGQDPARVFKTLVTRGHSGAYCVFVLPCNRELDLKAAAKAAGEKSVEMIHVAEINRVTGYIRGGCSPVGMKKKYPTFLDETCELCDRIAVSAGQRGVQMLLRPADLARYVEAKICDIAQ